MPTDASPPREDNAALLNLFLGLRVADIRDGLDACGHHYVGSMTPDIRPLWRTRTIGVARTARYLPYQGRVPEATAEAYLEWSGWYYNNVCTYPWMQTIREGDLVVIDQSGVNCGLMGSENTLTALKLGVRGFVSNGGVRDTDEIILQKLPFWSRIVSQGMVQSRLQFDAMDRPVCVGRQTVCPGDVVAADGDGVVVVPQDIAADVAAFGQEEHARDMANRGKHYDDLGRTRDDTLE